MANNFDRYDRYILALFFIVAFLSTLLQNIWLFFIATLFFIFFVLKNLDLTNIKTEEELEDEEFLNSLDEALQSGKSKTIKETNKRP